MKSQLHFYSKVYPGDIGRLLNRFKKYVQYLSKGEFIRKKIRLHKDF